MYVEDLRVRALRNHLEPCSLGSVEYLELLELGGDDGLGVGHLEAVLWIRTLLSSRIRIKKYLDPGGRHNVRKSLKYLFFKKKTKKKLL